MLHADHVQAEYWILSCDPNRLSVCSDGLELECIVVLEMGRSYLSKICVLRVVGTFKEVVLFQLVIWDLQ